MIRFVPVGGFLGAGKTTAVLAAARRFEAAGERVSIVTNDQGADLVDTVLARTAPVSGVEEVTGGCFCCRFDDLAAVIERLVAEVRPTVVLAEAVGSCTDLQSTVIRPLRRLYGGRLDVASLAVLIDPLRYRALRASWLGSESDLAYLYRHQLDEADVIVVNKADLLDADEAAEVVADIETRFLHARVLTLSARTGEGFDDLLDVWSGHSGAPTDRRAFAVDYGRYGAAEAELAWTNQTFGLAAVADTFSPDEWVSRFLDNMADSGATIGHVKVCVTSGDGITKASLTGAGLSYDARQPDKAPSAAVTLNARVAVPPDDLDRIVAASVAVADRAAGAASTTRRGDVFQPGFPVPVHRM